MLSYQQEEAGKPSVSVNEDNEEKSGECLCMRVYVYLNECMYVRVCVCARETNRETESEIDRERASGRAGERASERAVVPVIVIVVNSHPRAFAFVRVRVCVYNGV